MKTLYVIGNGFDKHHDFKTSYEDFADYLKQRNVNLYNILVEYIRLPDCNNLWYQFEENLGYFAPEVFNLKARNTNAALELIDELFLEFKRFILNVSISNTNAEFPLLPIYSDALFLSFNYTATLEVLYKIHPSNILYIHEKAEHNDTKLLLGHGLDISDSVDNVFCPPYLSEEKKINWVRENHPGASCDPERNNTLQFIDKCFKPTAEIIKQNYPFFNKLTNIDEVIVLGHSLSEVDMPYFRKIKKRVKRNARWTVSFYKTSEKGNHLNAIMSLGVDEVNIEIIELKNLQSV